MKRIYYNKLIRDHIPEQIRANNADFEAYALDEEMFELELLKKVGEEASGLLAAQTREELLDELADVMRVLEEIKRVKLISDEELRAVMDTHEYEKGGFNEKLFLVWSSNTNYKTNERRYDKL